MIEKLSDILRLWVKNMLVMLVVTAIVGAVACACMFVGWLFFAGYPLWAMLTMVIGVTLVAAIVEA